MNRARFIQGMNSNIELSEKERRRIIKASVRRCSWKLKCTVAMEELAELSQQVSKQIRGFNDKMGLLEEMADVYICMEHLKLLFNLRDDEIQKAIDVKLERERRNCE